MWNKPCVLLVFSWAQVVCVFIISCVAEHAHAQRDPCHYVIVLFCAVMCSTDAEPVCQVFLSSLSCRLLVFTRKSHDFNVMWFLVVKLVAAWKQRVPSCAHIVQWLEQGLTSCPQYNQHEKNAPLLSTAYIERGVDGRNCPRGEKAQGATVQGAIILGGNWPRGELSWGGNWPGGNWPRGELSWGGIIQGEIGGGQLSGGNCPGGNWPDTLKIDTVLCFSRHLDWDPGFLPF